MEHSSVPIYEIKNQLTNNDIISVLKQLLNFLAYMSDCCIIVNNISESTVLVNLDNKKIDVKFYDFTESSQSNLLETESKDEKSVWTAPEVIKNGFFSHNSDLFSVGALVIGLFNGEPLSREDILDEKIVKATLKKKIDKHNVIELLCS